jgi:hypothetical protein
VTAAENVRAFLAERKPMRGLDPEHITAANEAVLTVSDLTALVIMAEAFQAEHPDRAAVIEHGECTKDCFHLRA